MADFAPDPDRTFVVVSVSLAPRATYAPNTPADLSHIEMKVSLRQLAAWMKEVETNG